MTKQLGLIGWPLAHSFSPDFFRTKWEKEGISGWRYDVFPLDDIEQLPYLLTQLSDLCGLNVTIPYKQAVMSYVHIPDDISLSIGAVNTLVINDGTIFGYNTDGPAFLEVVRKIGIPSGTKALILGNGGAAQAVRWALRQLELEFTVVSRSGEEGTVTWEQINPSLIREHQLIIQTTPLGMYPNNHTFSAIPYAQLDTSHILIDLVYNPLETCFLQIGREQGARTFNGLEMLYLQAEKSWEIWYDHCSK